MTKLTNLMQFSKSLALLLASLPSGSWNRSSTSVSTSSSLPPLNLDSDADSRAILGRWAMDLIDTLVGILEQKAKTQLRPRSSLAASLFILNNLSEIEKRVRADRVLQNVIGSLTSAEREKDVSRRISRGSSGSNSSLTAFAMPRSFEKAKRAGLDGMIRFWRC
jgi:Exo70 exocyst complex subunit